ncbi:MAG: hypothetical protein Q4B65_00880 [Candidatus Saccharibacteria bacterium]|nr:hypothetical protein [Candidatus Saccharibacteria bacterium]
MAGEKVNTGGSEAPQESVWDSLSSYDQDDWVSRTEAVIDGIKANSTEQAAKDSLDRAVDEKSERINNKLDDLVNSGTMNAEWAETLKARREKMAEAERTAGVTAEDIAYQEHLRNMDQLREDDPYYGEENLNSRTGKERTTSEFDLYPKMEGETNEAYGARLRRMHEMTKAFEEQEREKAAAEEGEDAEAAERARLEAEERARLEAEERARIEAEEREQQEAEERERLEAEEREKLQKEKAELEARKKEIQDEINQLSGGPLVAINADFTEDVKELARDLAEQDLNAEVAKAGIIKRLWKGTLFKKYFTKKYENEYLDGDRKHEGKTAEELVTDRSEGAMARFVLGATESMAYVHKKAGENLEKADPETNEKVKNAIEKFATAKIPEGKTLEDLKLQFREEMGRAGAEASDDGKDVDKKIIDNYLEVAIQARERAEHGIAIEKVMEGFQVYNAIARDGVRTEAHKDKIDKAVDWLEGSSIGAIVPTQVIAGALSVVSALTQTGARAAAGVAGGMLVSSALSGLKERNRITEDRARMMRDAANGLEYSGTKSEGGEDDEDSEEKLSRRERKIAKYEKKIGGTLYELQPASDLTSNIEAALAMEPGEARDKALMSAITEARVRIDFSDSEQKDLISYSSADKRGDERLALDRALIRAERSLSEADSTRADEMKSHLLNEIEDDVDERDDNFKRTRTWLAAKKATRTLIIGATTFLASQEVVAAFDPGKIGILEKAGILKTDNASDASETVAASVFGIARGNQVSSEISGDDTVARDQLKQAGYKETKISDAYTTEETTMMEVDPANAKDVVRVKTEWANNGTKVSDGNELRLFRGSDGSYVANMPGNSTMPDGSIVNFGSGEPVAILNLGGQNFEIPPVGFDSAGQPIFTTGDFATTANGTVIKIAENGEKLFKTFSTGFKSGVDANGVMEYTSLATDVGNNSFSGTILEKVSRVVTHPAKFIYSKARDISFGGLAFAPETARTGLGDTTAAPAPEGERIVNIDGTNGPEMIVDGERVPSSSTAEEGTTSAGESGTGAPASEFVAPEGGETGGTASTETSVESTTSSASAGSEGGFTAENARDYLRSLTPEQREWFRQLLGEEGGTEAPEAAA